MLNPKALHISDLSVRSLLPEVMDQPNAPVEETRQALAEIGFINRWLGGYGVILSALGRLDWHDQTITIMDLGCGGGDTLRAIADWAAKNHKQVNLIGVDWNPVMTQYAASLSLDYPAIGFKVMDVFDTRLSLDRADVTMNSLFCHHFDDDQLVRLVRRMYNMSSQAVIINDIARHWFAYHSIRILTGIFSKTDMVKYDAPLSVARSLTRREWELILSRAGFRSYSLRWMWAWRWQIIIPRSPENNDNRP